MRRIWLSFSSITFAIGLWIAVGEGRLPAADKDKDPPKKPQSRFTIGKETTYVTGPVDKEGYIDYAAALNERLREGVTPDNNANVLLWKAFGPTPEGSRMPAEFFKWMKMDEPPAKGDYFTSSYQHMNKLATDNPERKQAELEKDWEATGERPWKAKDYPQVIKWLIANDKSLALVVEASRRERYFSPLVPRKIEGKSRGLMTVPLPGVQKCRSVAEALATRAMLHLGEGRDEEAWQDLLALHRLGRLVARGGTLVDGLTGINLDSVALRADLVFLERTKLDAKRLRGCLRDVATLPPLPSMGEQVDLGERFMFLELVLLIDRHGFAYLETLSSAKNGGSKEPTDEGKRLLEGIQWDLALTDANRWYDRVAAAMRLKDRDARERELRKIHLDLDKRTVSLTDALIAAEAPKTKGKMIGDVLIRLFMPATQRLHQAADRTEQTQRNLHVAFALAVYHREEGRYPKTLDALAPKYLAQVPQDLFSGKALNYRPSEKGYLLYSVGINGKDEGGRGRDDDPPGDDLSVRMPRPR